MKTIKSAVSVVALFVWAFGLLVFAPGFSSTAFANSYSGRWAVLVEGTGTYTRPVNTQSELAQQFFDQGLRLMYGYYTLEAIASLMEALQHDSSNPMIYCGLALASGPNPNSRYGRLPDDPKGNARKAISMAIDFVDSASDKDRALIEAVYIRFDVDGYPEQSTRDRAYLEAMRDLFERYPEDPDIGTLYADAYMVTQPWSYWTFGGKAKPGTVVAAKALETVMARRPDHPGANHLYIHLIEAGPEPERALRAADRLEQLMPIAGHVVHMPSHIYVRTGQYEKAIATNERSLAADKRFNELWGDHPRPRTGTYFLSATNHGRHAVDFIRYAASVQGNYERAIAAAWEGRRNQSPRAIKRGIGQRDVITPWLVHKMFGQWEALGAEQRSYEGLPYVDGIWFYVHGSALVAEGDLGRAEDALAELQHIQADPASAKTFSRYNAVSSLLEIAALGLDGEIKQARGDLPGAIESFSKAVQIEDRLSYIEPPDWPLPMRHYLGAALLEADRAVEAEKVYRRDLAWNKDNGWALYGLWLSLKAQGREKQARQVRREFDVAWRNADVTLSSSRF
jgi:tetratricopeptide (TPR) repeat protein